MQTESSCPYQAKDKTCRDSNSGDYRGAHVTGQYNKWDTASEKSESRGSQVNVFIPSEVEIRPPKPQLQKKKTQIIGFNEYVGIDAGDSL